MIRAAWALALTASLAIGARPAPARTTAPIVSPVWNDPARRDAAGEVGQLTSRLNIVAGMRIADIGAGDGYDALRLAPKVGPRGRIIAEDVREDYLAELRRRARAQGASNIVPLLGTAGDPHLAARSVDLVLMVHMYHEVAQPEQLLAHLAAALKPGGRLAIEDLDRPILAHGTPIALLRCELAAAGWRELALRALDGGLGYLAVFAPSSARRRPARIAACAG